MYDLALITPTPIRELTRVGDANDGGYVIPDVCLATTDTLVSLGLAFNWSFDDAFVKASQASVIGVDGSLTRWGFVRRSIQKSRHALGYLLTLNIAKAKLRFARSADIMRWGNTFFRSAGDGRSRMYKRFVSRKVGPEFITIDALLSDRARKELSVFVKMDIEGSEYEVLHELRAHAATINGLVIEFHELGARGDEFSAGIRSLLERFAIVHVHANNIGGVIPGTALPETLEITFLNAALMSGTSRRSTSPEYPIRGLDMPCSAKLPDLPIHFVHHEARPTTDKGHG